MRNLVEGGTATLGELTIKCIRACVDNAGCRGNKVVDHPRHVSVSGPSTNPKRTPLMLFRPDGRIGAQKNFTKNHTLFLPPPSLQVYHKIQRICSGRTSTLGNSGPARKNGEADLDGLLDPKHVDARIAANNCVTAQEMQSHLGNLARMRGTPYINGVPDTTQLKVIIKRYNERHAGSEDRPIIGLQNAKLTSTARAAFSGNYQKVLRCQVWICWPRAPRHQPRQPHHHPCPSTAILAASTASAPCVPATLHRNGHNLATPLAPIFAVESPCQDDRAWIHLQPNAHPHG